MMKEQLAAANTLILNGRLDEAAHALSLLDPIQPSDARAKAHFQAIVEFQRGHIAHSFQMMQAALEKYGDNVNLRRDLTVCQYHLQDMQGFRSSLSLLENQLIELESQLGGQSLIECELMTGKFLEEDARLAPAAQFYERALRRAAKPAHRWRALIQKARWQALFDPQPELSAHYRELISVDQRQVTADLRIELEHSLMLIELRLIGADHAWQRVERLLDDGIAEIDQRLLVFDFIAGGLDQNLPIHASVLNKQSDFKDLDPFEGFLRNIVKESLEPQTLLHELAALAPKLPWASHLRLLCIAANLDQNSAVRQELHRKIQLILLALDPGSQVLWMNRLRQSLQTQEIRIDFSARGRSMSIGGKTLDLSKKKIGLQLFERLVTNPSLSVEEAIQLLWRTEFSPEHYHRLRMSVHRLNTLIHETAGLGKVVEVDSQHVRLRPEVRLRRSPMDEGFDLGLMGV